MPFYLQMSKNITQHRDILFRNIYIYVTGKYITGKVVAPKLTVAELYIGGFQITINMNYEFPLCNIKFKPFSCFFIESYRLYFV